MHRRRTSPVASPNSARGAVRVSEPAIVAAGSTAAWIRRRPARGCRRTWWRQNPSTPSPTGMIDQPRQDPEDQDGGGDLVDPLLAGGGGQHADVGDLADPGVTGGDREHGQALDEREHDEHLGPRQHVSSDTPVKRTHISSSANFVAAVSIVAQVATSHRSCSVCTADERAATIRAGRSGGSGLRSSRSTHRPHRLDQPAGLLGPLLRAQHDGEHGDAEADDQGDRSRPCAACRSIGASEMTSPTAAMTGSASFTPMLKMPPAATASVASPVVRPHDVSIWKRTGRSLGPGTTEVIDAGPEVGHDAAAHRESGHHRRRQQTLRPDPQDPHAQRAR